MAFWRGEGERRSISPCGGGAAGRASGAPISREEAGGGAVGALALAAAPTAKRLPLDGCRVLDITIDLRKLKNLAPFAALIVPLGRPVGQSPRTRCPATEFILGRGCRLSIMDAWTGTTAVVVRRGARATREAIACTRTFTAMRAGSTMQRPASWSALFSVRVPPVEPRRLPSSASRFWARSGTNRYRCFLRRAGHQPFARCGEGGRPPGPRRPRGPALDLKGLSSTAPSGMRAGQKRR